MTRTAITLAPTSGASDTDALTPLPAPPPHNIEAEQSLLGAVLVNNEALYRVADFLEPVHFFEPVHQQIYEVARSLIRNGKLASPITLTTRSPGCASDSIRSPSKAQTAWRTAVDRQR